MLFNTLDYILFLPIVIIGYYLLNAKYRWALLLIASYYFYMCWKPEYVVLILASTLIDYFAGLQMAKRDSKKKRRPFLYMSLAANLGILFAFKYANFFSETATNIAHSMDFMVHFPLFDFLLPVGISFYTFQTISYSIDVYNDKIRPERHLGHFALFVSFFPQLVAGPIERFSSLSPQLKRPQSFDYENFKNGLRMILFGLFAKMVIADNAAPIADVIFNDPELYNSFNISLGLFFYSFQLYCDFFGYSLIAIGSALIMGIKLMDNFNSPYLSVNVADFWRRWHISLSTWFRDYIYFPMGGNRVRKMKWIFNIVAVFVISGFWHGASFTFIFWGLLVGLLYVIEMTINKALKIRTEIKPFSANHLLRAAKTFIIISFTWIFFRSLTFADSWIMFDALFSNGGLDGKTLDISMVLWLTLAGFIVLDWVLYNKRFDTWVGRQPFVLRWVLYAMMIFSIMVFTGVEEIPFIYFQF
ncbi:MAG: MBOAT family O-acyltransferase [Crocinitomicaceae bacterium]|nr:MBOAT family O-acyltransferase [Crocinitomicaceae bacterium]